MNINKNYLITFSVSFLVIITIAIIALMLMLPRQSSVLKGTVKSYDQISKSQYTFEATKDITNEPLTKQYSVTTDDITKYKNNSQYKTGNTDPFTPTTSNNNANDTTKNTNNKSTTRTTTTTTNTTNSKEYKEAVEKTTNSNGGIQNPDSTEK